MKYTELKRHIQQADDGLYPVYLVYGTDDYLKYEAVKTIKSVVDPDYADLNIMSFSYDGDIDDTIDALNVFSLFSKYKVVVLEGVDKMKDADMQKLKAYCASPCEGSVLVVRCGSEFARLLKGKTIQTVVCNELDDAEIREEIDAVLSEPPVRSIADDAVAELILRTRKSMARIISETRKLKAYSDSVIRKKDVEDMVVSDLEYQIYKLTEAVGAKNADGALEVLDRLLAAGVKPKVIVDSLYDRYRRILHVSLNRSASNEFFAEKFFTSPNAIYYLRRAAENYSQVKLKSVVDYLHSLQYDILSGKRQEESAMHEAILTLLAL